MADYDISDAQRQVDEGTTKHFSCTLLAEDQITPLTAAAMLSITISEWYLDRSGTKRTINSRKSQNVNGANNGVFATTSGVFDLYWQTADTTIQNPDLSVKTEEHHFRLEWTYNSSNGVRGGQYRDFFVVRRKPTQV